MNNIRFLSENFHFLAVKFSIYLNRRVFVMGDFVCGFVLSLFFFLLLLLLFCCVFYFILFIFFFFSCCCLFFFCHYFFSSLGKAVLRDCCISWVSSLVD